MILILMSTYIRSIYKLGLGDTSNKALRLLQQHTVAIIADLRNMHASITIY